MHELVDLIGWKSHYYLYSAVLYDANAGAGPEHNSETGNLLSVNHPPPLVLQTRCSRPKIAVSSMKTIWNKRDPVDECNSSRWEPIWPCVAPYLKAITSCRLLVGSIDRQFIRVARHSLVQSVSSPYILADTPTPLCPPAARYFSPLAANSAEKNKYPRTHTSTIGVAAVAPYAG